MSLITFPSRREYSSEYRKSFRPFSQYEYVDGRFVPSVGFHLVSTLKRGYNDVTTITNLMI